MNLLTIILSMTIPFISALSDSAPQQIAENVKNNGVSVDVNTVNWAEYPYAPKVKATLAHDAENLYCFFEVNERHLLVKTLEDNGPVWEDSCVELFIADPDGRHYYNFETNAAGVGLASKRESRNDFVRFTPEQMARMIRVSSLDRRCYDDKDGDRGIEWTLLLSVPFDLIGHETVPENISLNIYKCGDATETPHFLSWAPIPIESPDFHRPDFFREVPLQSPQTK